MEKIIDAVPTEDIIKELTEERFVRKTNFGHNEIYVVNAHNAPNTMREIGRLREWAFRESGGGTGKSIDIDEFDTRDEAYFEQLIVWDPIEKEILGGYRFIDCSKLPIKNNGQVDTPTSELFYYSEDFIRDYLPYTIELGRSFIQPKYQSTGNVRKSIFTLDNLWDGLGAILNDIPSAKYFFGKVTMYSQYDPALRDMILFFIGRYREVNTVFLSTVILSPGNTRVPVELSGIYPLNTIPACSFAVGSVKLSPGLTLLTFPSTVTV